jgi:hypothetical protein
MQTVLFGPAAWHICGVVVPASAARNAASAWPRRQYRVFPDVAPATPQSHVGQAAMQAAFCAA